MNLVAPGGVLQDATSRIRQSGEQIYHYQGVSSFAEEAIVPATGAIRIRKDAPLDVVCRIGISRSTTDPAHERLNNPRRYRCPAPASRS